MSGKTAGGIVSQTLHGGIFGLNSNSSEEIKHIGTLHRYVSILQNKRTRNGIPNVLYRRGSYLEYIRYFILHLEYVVIPHVL